MILAMDETSRRRSKIFFSILWIKTALDAFQTIGESF